MVTSITINNKVLEFKDCITDQTIERTEYKSNRKKGKKVKNIDGLILHMILRRNILQLLKNFNLDNNIH